MNYKFSYQQIVGINYCYSKIRDATFEEDDVRLLLIYLREFLVNNPNVISQKNANFLRELGDSIAHTVREKGTICKRIEELLKQFVSSNPNRRYLLPPFTLFDIDDLVEALKRVLVETGVLYDANDIERIFQKYALDLKLCILCLLDGMLFKISDSGSTKHFFTKQAEGKHSIFVRTELDLKPGGGLKEIRLEALIPLRPHGIYGQAILFCPLNDQNKIEDAALKRTDSREGYCESLKALRHNGQLMIRKITPIVDCIGVSKILEKCSYDTHPIGRPR